MKKILIVDDNDANRNLAFLTFELEPYRLLMAENGEQALAMAQTEKPDVVLLDVMMPDMDGYTVCERLRHGEQTKNLYIIMVTVKGQTWDREAGYAAGANDYVVKPYSPLELRHRVTTVLEAHPVC